MTGDPECRIVGLHPGGAGRQEAMRDIELQGVRMLAAAMAGGPTDWRWDGPHLSQCMIGITEQRAKDYAARWGGTASKIGTVSR